MSEVKRTITVTVHEGSEVPDGLTYAYMSTDTGWELVSWYKGTQGWHTIGTIWASNDTRPVGRVDGHCGGGGQE